MSSLPPDDGPRIDVAVLRAARFATCSPDAGESLRRLLASMVADTGAAAGAVLEHSPLRARALWRLDSTAVAPLLREGGPIADALERQDDWGEGVLSLNGDPLERVGGAEFQGLLLVPLRARGFSVGVVALLFGGLAPSAADDLDRALVMGSFVGLVLENERLYEGARAAGQARDHFLAALNHEVRTPATSLVLIADMIRTTAPEALPPRLERLLHEAEEQITLLMDVLHRVLDLGRIEEHADAERSEIVQPRQAVTELMRRLEPAAKRKGLAFALHTPRDLPPLQTDGSRVSRILLHLLSNAIKYTSEGRVEVWLERTSARLGRNRPEPVLAIRVNDSGRGIPAHELERIFEPFTQVDEGARTESRMRGVGLGLPIARQLARTLGGEVLVESAPGRGTTATLMLPYSAGSGAP